MENQPAARHQPTIVPVIYIGTGLPGAVARELWAAGVGVLRFTSATRALRLLRHCRIQGVLYGDSTLEHLEDFHALQVPVIVLASDNQGWDADGVTIVDCRSDPGTIAALIRHTLVRPDDWIAA